jgi:hypothetical protein
MQNLVGITLQFPCVLPILTVFSTLRIKMILRVARTVTDLGVIFVELIKVIYYLPKRRSFQLIHQSANKPQHVVAFSNTCVPIRATSGAEWGDRCFCLI